LCCSRSWTIFQKDKAENANTYFQKEKLKFSLLLSDTSLVWSKCQCTIGILADLEENGIDWNRSKHGW
jgi:hypothetical protein